MPLSRPSRCATAATVVIAVVVVVRQIARLRRYAIAESSMEPALYPGDFVIAARLDAPHLLGDIVVFAHPHRPRFELVKRVIGRPGDVVELRNDRTYVNGDVVPEPWAKQPTETEGSWQLGPREIFVLGDQRQRSADDSRTLGPIAVRNARWVVRFRYWPPGRIGWV